MIVSNNSTSNVPQRDCSSGSFNLSEINNNLMPDLGGLRYNWVRFRIYSDILNGTKGATTDLYHSLPCIRNLRHLGSFYNFFVSIFLQGRRSSSRDIIICHFHSSNNCLILFLFANK